MILTIENTNFSFEVKVTIGLESTHPDSWIRKGKMTPTTNMVKAGRYFQCLTSETKNFDFQVKIIQGLESTHPDSQEARIGLNDPLC